MSTEQDTERGLDETGRKLCVIREFNIAPMNLLLLLRRCNFPLYKSKKGKLSDGAMTTCGDQP